MSNQIPLLQVFLNTVSKMLAHVGLDRQLMIDTETYRLYVHDGVTKGGHALRKYDDPTEDIRAIPFKGPDPEGGQIWVMGEWPSDEDESVMVPAYVAGELAYELTDDDVSQGTEVKGLVSGEQIKDATNTYELTDDDVSEGTEVKGLVSGEQIKDATSTYELTDDDISEGTKTKGLVSGDQLQPNSTFSNSLNFTGEEYAITGEDCDGSPILVFRLTGTLDRTIILPNENDVPEFAGVNEIIVACEGGIKFQSSTAGSGSNGIENPEEALLVGGVLRVIRVFTNDVPSSFWRVQKPAENIDTSTLNLKYLTENRTVVWEGDMKSPELNLGTLSEVGNAVGRYIVEASLAGYSCVVTVFQINSESSSLTSTCEVKHKLNTDGSLKNFHYVLVSGYTNELVFKYYIYSEASGSNSEFAIESIHKL